MACFRLTQRRETMEYKKIHYSVENGIAQITMDYMKNMNAIDVEMADELIDALAIAEGDTAVRTVVLAGSEKAFSAGGDIGYFYKRIQSGGEVNMDELLAKIEYLTDYMKKMDTMIVTSVSGPAAGAGVSLALSGDFLICADNAKFILAFVNLGLVPDTGATFLLTRSIGVHRTLELATTGRPVSAAEAKDWGLAYKVTTPEDLHDETLKLAKRLAAGPLLSYKNIKRQVYAASFATYKEWLAQAETPAQRECIASEDFKEGCKAFIEKRKAQFSGT